MPGMRTDLHQHLWTPQLIERLAARTRLPLIDRGDGRDILRADGERPYVIDPGANSAEDRERLADQDGVQRIVVALSSPIGIETLPRAEAVELIDAHLDGVQDLGDRFAAWGPIALDELDLDDVDRLVGRGCVGISLPAPALATPAHVEAAGPLLERICRAGAPVFVHPGRPASHRRREAPADEPVWWQALTGYVSQMHAAWLTWAASGRPRHPELVIVFAMLAGCAPWQAERFALRGGPEVDLQDPLTFYDTSGYGPQAVETMARLVGPWHLVYGSDRPVVEPARSGREASLLAQATEVITPSIPAVPA